MSFEPRTTCPHRDGHAEWTAEGLQKTLREWVLSRRPGPGRQETHKRPRSWEIHFPPFPLIFQPLILVQLGAPSAFLMAAKSHLLQNAHSGPRSWDRSFLCLSKSAGPQCSGAFVFRLHAHPTVPIKRLIRIRVRAVSGVINRQPTPTHMHEHSQEDRVD